MRRIRGLRGRVLKKLEEKLGSSEIGKEGVQDPPQVELGPLVDLYTKGKLEEAMAAVKRMLVKYPRSTAVYNIKGAVEMVLKDYERAIETFKVALQVDPFFAKAHMNLGLALTELNSFDDAQVSYRKAIEIKLFDFPEAYNNNLGNLFKQKGELDHALENYQKAIEIKPDFAEAYNNLGTALSEKVILKTL